MRFSSLAALAAGCVFSWAAGAADAGFTDAQARTSARDVRVPRALVAAVESDYRAFLAAHQRPVEGPLKRGLLNMTVELFQDRLAALSANSRIATPSGGGVIDLEDFVNPVKGAFHLRILAKDGKGDEVRQSKVYFIPRTKTRKIGGVDYGSGCNRYMDITSHFSRAMSSRGFTLYATDRRYLPVIGGTFLVVHHTIDALEVGSVTFVDGRYPEAACA